MNHIVTNYNQHVQWRSMCGKHFGTIKDLPIVNPHEVASDIIAKYCGSVLDFGCGVNKVHKSSYKIPDEHYFYRFVGHYLGSNANAFFLDFEYREFSIHYTDIDRGNNYILDFDDTWNEELPDVREKSKSIYLDWSGGCFDSRISVKSRLGYTWVDNYHHIENQYFEWPEIWLSLNYRLFFLTDI